MLSVISMTPSDKLNRDIGVSDHGIDSLMVVELMGKSRRELGIDLTNRDFIGDPSINQLSVQLLERIGMR